jgi:ribosomal-protein-alanine N-acetyltransferase
MLIRTATLADIPSLVGIAAESPSAGHWTEKQYEIALQSEHPQRIVLVLEELSSILGFAVAAEAAGEWELENIAITLAERRRGLSDRLLSTLLSDLTERHAGSIHLEVRQSNTAARALYKKWGFEEVGRRPGYYHKPPEDAILYKKILSQQLPKSIDRSFPRV